MLQSILCSDSTPAENNKLISSECFKSRLQQRLGGLQGRQPGCGGGRLRQKRQRLGARQAPLQHLCNSRLLLGGRVTGADMASRTAQACS